MSLTFIIILFCDTMTDVVQFGELVSLETDSYGLCEEISSGATLMATHAYTRNPYSHLGKETDLQQWDTLVFKGEHAQNEHWRLV